MTIMITRYDDVLDSRALLAHAEDMLPPLLKCIAQTRTIYLKLNKKLLVNYVLPYKMAITYIALLKAAG